MEPYTVQGMAKIEGRELDLGRCYSINDIYIHIVDCDRNRFV